MKPGLLYPRVISVGLFFLLFLGCIGTVTTPIPVGAPPAAAAAPSTTATPSLSATLFLPPLPAATLGLPVSIGTTLPQPSIIISPGNADNIVEIARWVGQASTVLSVAFSPDGRTLASTSAYMVKLWDVSSGSEMHTLGYTGIADNTAFSPDGKTLALRADDTTVILYDAASGRELRRLSAPKDIGYDVVFSPDGRTLAATSFDGTVKLWDVSSGSELPGLSTPATTDEVVSVAFSPDGKTLASTYADTVILWDLVSGSELRSLNVETYAASVTFSPDGSLLAVITFIGVDQLRDAIHILTLWDVAGGTKLRRLGGDPDRGWSPAFSPDGRTLAIGLVDGSAVILYDVTGGEELRRLSGHSNGVNAVAFSPDGRFIASGSGDDTIRLWGIYP